MEATFFSTVVNKMDLKGRVSIPAPFRNQLIAESNGSSNVALLPSFQLPMVEGSGLSRIERLRLQLERHQEFSDEFKSIQAFFGEFVHLVIDSEGRVTLPPILLEHANITDTVAFVGAGTVFQIWEPSAYNEHKALMRRWKLDAGTTFPPVRPDQNAALLAGAGAIGGSP